MHTVTRNRKHRRAAAKPAACVQNLMLLTVGSKGGKEGGRRATVGSEEDVERLHAKFHLKVFTVSSSCGQKPQFLANFDIWTTRVYRPHFTDAGQIWRATADPRSIFTRQMSSECVHCVSFRWVTKTTILRKLTLGDALPASFYRYRWGPNLVC